MKRMCGGLPRNSAERMPERWFRPTGASKSVRPAEYAVSVSGPTVSPAKASSPRPSARAANGDAPFAKPRKTLFAEASRSETAELSRWVGQPDLMRFARIGDSLYGYYATPFADIRSAAEYLNTLHSGICMGQMFGGRLKPDHSLAMFHDLARSAAAETPLSSDEALHYLRREDFAPQAEAAEGMNLMTFEGYALGWAKRIGNRFNNLYPKSQMILNK